MKYKVQNKGLIFTLSFHRSLSNYLHKSLVRHFPLTNLLIHIQETYYLAQPCPLRYEVFSIKIF